MRSLTALAFGSPVLAGSCQVPLHSLCCSLSGKRSLRSLTGSCKVGLGSKRSIPGIQQVRQSCSRASFQIRASSEQGQYDYDLFTIGAGTGGVRASRFAANYGAKVAICELPFALISSETRGGPGGTCVLRGCVPKKMLSIGGEMREAIDAAAEFGWELDSPPRLNWDRMRQNKNKELERLSGVYMKQIETAGIHFVEGRGKLLDAHTVEVNGQKFTAKNILLAVGTKSIVPPIDGAEHTITSDGILDLPKCPKKLVVVGGGYIAAEQASIYKNYGAEVHMLYRSDALLAGFDKDCVTHITEQFQLRGINLSASTSPVKIVKDDNGQLTVTAEKKNGEKITLDKVDQMLMATGRKPNTLNLGLEDVGVKLGDQKEVVVNDINQSVSTPSVWALGDCSYRKPLTPVARMEGTTFAQHVFGGMKDVKPEYDCVASVVFSTPQLATVGLSEQQALDKHDNIDVFLSTFKPMQNTISKSEGKALMKLVVNADDDTLLGAHMVGPEAAEILQGFSAIVKFGIKKSQLDRTVGIHPTSAEEFVTMREPTRRFRNKKLQEH